MVAADLEPSSEKARRHQTTFVGRRQEINIQFNQLIDAVLLVLAICWLTRSAPGLLSRRLSRVRERNEF
jgi:hypothetical protein